MPNIIDSFHEPTYEELKNHLKAFLQIPQKKAEVKAETPVTETKSPKPSGLNVTVDHDATNEGFEVEKTDKKAPATANIDDIEAMFAEFSKK